MKGTEQNPLKPKNDNISTTSTVKMTKSTRVRLKEAQESNQELVEMNSKLLEDKKRMLVEQEQARAKMEQLQQMMQNMRQAQESTTTNVVSPPKQPKENNRNEDMHTEEAVNSPATNKSTSIKADSAGAKI